MGTDEPAFWTSGHRISAASIHVAFSARDRAMADAFHAAALDAGGTEDGPPGPRGPAEMKYYAAFVLDPDRNNIEAGVRA